MSLQDDVINSYKDDVKKASESLKVDLGRLRTGRANISLLDGVRVDYYGTPTPLAQCANLATPDPRLITIKPYDKSIIVEIEKAITKADLGLNPQTDGQIIRVPIPQLTEERRRDLVKQAKNRGEEAKISIRNARRDSNELIKEAQKDGEVTEDDAKRALEKIQEETDKGIKAIDELIGKKEKEISEV